MLLLKNNIKVITMKSLENIQIEQRDLLKGIEHPRLGNIVGLFEEVGELSKEVMEIEMYGEDKKSELSDECADVLFSLLALCDSYNVNLAEAYAKKIDKISKKIPDWHKKYGKKLESLRIKLD